ncbi:hypothetical protein L1987_74092 [Smallanthus sonchifolius]|uniref:Uncharacterized protein n=1 Tax=Smallanthus sonchifolius TaxID=185202 RepID=A0ACB9A1N7_9ASTR|nr:hypothetical protein L1987_74092 [Smallanthus sonchifolius]
MPLSRGSSLHFYPTSRADVDKSVLVSFPYLELESENKTPNLGIETLNGTNFSTWKDSLMLSLGLIESDQALDKPAPAELTDKSTSQDIIKHEKWSRCNRMPLVLIKNSISPIIRGAIPDSKDAKTFLSSVED